MEIIRNRLLRPWARYFRRGRNGSGFTLMELMLVMAIIAIVLILALIGIRIQITRGFDAKRKADLADIRRAFEEYYNDKGCYPPAAILNNCGSGDLRPYMNLVPCDPVTKRPYVYVPLAGNECGGYVACASLGDLQDRDIEQIGCGPITGCGWGSGYNYCLANGMSVLAPGFDPLAGTPTPTLSPTPAPGRYACSPGGVCNDYGSLGNAQGAGCPVTYADIFCEGDCIDNANWCDY